MKTTETTKITPVIQTSATNRIITRLAKIFICIANVCFNCCFSCFKSKANTKKVDVDKLISLIEKKTRKIYRYLYIGDF